MSSVRLAEEVLVESDDANVEVGDVAAGPGLLFEVSDNGGMVAQTPTVNGSAHWDRVGNFSERGWEIQTSWTALKR